MTRFSRFLIAVSALAAYTLAASAQHARIDDARSTPSPSPYGLTGAYYVTGDLTGAAVMTVDRQLDFTWPAGTAPKNLSSENFSVRWTGSITAPVSGTYRIVTLNDDGARVWIDGLSVIDDWNGHGPIQNSAPIRLQAGDPMPIEIEYADWAQGGRFRLEWIMPKGTREVIPARALRPHMRRSPREWSNASMRDLADARGIIVGATVDEGKFDDPDYRALINREFNQLQHGGACLIANTHTDGGALLDPLQRMDDTSWVAQENDQRQMCYHLIWYQESQWSPWLNDLTREEKVDLIDIRIERLINLFDTRIQDWSVVNEAFDDATGALRPVDVATYPDGSRAEFTNWLGEFDESYIDRSFAAARAANDWAVLFYNDYGMEFGGVKWESVKALTTRLVEAGTIDGVGFQAHFDLDGLPENPGDLKQALKDRFAEVYAISPQLQVRVTELDIGKIGGMTDEETARQGAYFGAVMQACLEAKNCTGVSTWGVYDGVTWRPGQDPLAFDDDLSPKLAYDAMVAALR